MRGRALLATVVLAVAVGVLSWPGPVAASCVGPVLGVGEHPDPAVAAAVTTLSVGADLAVRGAWFREGCDDHQQVGAGPSGGGAACAGPSEPESPVTVTEEVTPMQDVSLVLVQGDLRWPLGTADADAAFDIAWDVVVPDDAAPGPAVLEAGGTELQVALVAG